MEFKTVIYADLNNISHLQPQGWGNIIPEFDFYVREDFCHPVKAVFDKKIVGIGASISFDTTAWLAHIIVDMEYRKLGIGRQIVYKLVDDLKSRSVKTILLLATGLGMSIYKRAGFRIVSEYMFFQRNARWPGYRISGNIVPFQKDQYASILKMDYAISGEHRERLINKYLDRAVLYLENNKLWGYYLPHLREGLIVADSEKAGMELMKYKYSKIDRASLPCENLLGIGFLKESGFQQIHKQGTRMILGDPIAWQPEKIFSRIGGNYG